MAVFPEPPPPTEKQHLPSDSALLQLPNRANSSLASALHSSVSARSHKVPPDCGAHPSEPLPPLALEWQNPDWSKRPRPGLQPSRLQGRASTPTQGRALASSQLSKNRRAIVLEQKQTCRRGDRNWQTEHRRKQQNHRAVPTELEIIS